MEIVYDKEVIEEWLNRLNASILVKMKIAALNTKKSIIDEEIAEAKGAISNENIWLNGSSTDEERVLHSQNIATLTYYIDKLEEMKDE